MTAYIITTDGRCFYAATKCWTEHGAIDKLWERVDQLRECFEVRREGCRREPCEITAEYLMATCREVVEL